jgi:hypothetical protein
METRRIGRHVVLQRHGDIDQSSGHRRFPRGFPIGFAAVTIKTHPAAAIVEAFRPGWLQR